MRIGINFQINDEYISGIEYYSLGLLNALLQIDTQNEYIAFTNRPYLVRQHVSQSPNLTIVEIKHLRTRIARILWEHTQLPHVVKKHGLNVLHCPQYISPFQTSPVPYVVTIHDTIAIDSPKWCKQSNSLYFGLFMKATTRKASSIISVSKAYL